MMLLHQENLMNYIVSAHCENNQDSDYERNSLNSVIHVPLMVLLYNSTCNSNEHRTILTSHKNGMPLVRFMFESICRHREEHQGKPDTEDPENEQVLEWFERLAVKLLTNQDTDGQEPNISMIKPFLTAIEDDDTLNRKFFSFLHQLCESYINDKNL